MRESGYTMKNEITLKIGDVVKLNPSSLCGEYNPRHLSKFIFRVCDIHSIPSGFFDCNEVETKISVSVVSHPAFSIGSRIYTHEQTVTDHNLFQFAEFRSRIPENLSFQFLQSRVDTEYNTVFQYRRDPVTYRAYETRVKEKKWRDIVHLLEKDYCISFPETAREWIYQKPVFQYRKNELCNLKYTFSSSSLVPVSQGGQS